MSLKIENINELLSRFAYRVPVQHVNRDKPLVVAILTSLYGGVDTEQLVRCGLFTREAAYAAVSRLYAGKRQLLDRTNVIGADYSAYKSKASVYEEIPEELREIYLHLLSHSAEPLNRVHELYCSNIGLALTYSNVEKFRPLFKQVLVRGISSMSEAFRTLDNEVLFTNTLAPDMVARKREGALFFEVDRATEGYRKVGRKFMDYFEVFRTFPSAEICESAVIVSSFSYRKEKGVVGVRKQSLLRSPGKDIFENGCRFACASLRGRTSDVFKGEDFIKCSYSGLRFLIVSGFSTWYPDSLNELLPKESGNLLSMISPILRLVGRIGELPVAEYERDVDGDNVVFPVCVIPTDISGTNSTPIIYENISADHCGAERAVKLITARNFIRPQNCQRAFLVMDVESEDDAISFLEYIGERSASLYPQSDLQFHYLLKQGLYRSFRIVMDGCSPTYDNIGHGFIFRCGDKFFLPENDDSFIEKYLSYLRLRA